MRQNEKIYCNKCGREIEKDKLGICPDFLAVKKEWGFFSDKDMEIHKWDLCESCYDEFVQGFVIPAEKAETLEI